MTRNKRNNKINKTLDIVRVEVAGQNPGAQKKPNKKGNKKGSNKKGIPQSSANMYLKGLMRPDLTGPWRQPRLGHSPNTVLAQRRGFASITGTASAADSFLLYTINGYGNPGIMGGLTSASPSVNWTTPTVQAAAIVFPPAVDFIDINIVAMCIRIVYVGAPINASGTLVIGSLPDPGAVNLGNSSFNSLRYHPAMTELSVSSLLNTQVTCYMRKSSTTADDFVAVATTTGNADVEEPVVCFTGLSPGQTIEVHFFAIYEGRAGFNGANIVPSDREAAISPQLASLYGEARRVASIPMSPVTADTPTYLETAAQVAGSFLPSPGSTLASLAGAAAGAAGLSRRYRNYRPGYTAALGNGREYIY